MAPSQNKKARRPASGKAASVSKPTRAKVAPRPLLAKPAEPVKAVKPAQPAKAVEPAKAAQPAKAAAGVEAPRPPSSQGVSATRTTQLTAPAGPKILITGATGFLGSHLVRLLATRTDPRRIRTLQTSDPPPSWLTRLGVETVQGSVTSPDDVKRALEGVNEVYHLAGMVSSKEEDAHKMYALHVDGTRVLGEAAVAAGVRRLVMASTSGTVAVSKHADASLDETCPTPLEIISRWPYYASKAYQEETARGVLGDKVELVIVNPSLLLGPGDDRLSSTRMILQFLGREILVTPPGGLSFVDARDVAAFLPVAMEKGRPGERYLLGAANWTFEELFGRLSRMSKVAPPLVKARSGTASNVSLWLTRAQASLYRHWGKTPPLEPSSVEMAGYYWYFDGRKAHEELGFVPRDPTDTLFDTISYVREHFLDGFKGAVVKGDERDEAGASPQDLADEAAYEASLPS